MLTTHEVVNTVFFDAINDVDYEIDFEVDPLKKKWEGLKDYLVDLYGANVAVACALPDRDLAYSITMYQNGDLESDDISTDFNFGVGDE